MCIGLAEKEATDAVRNKTYKTFSASQLFHIQAMFVDPV